MVTVTSCQVDGSGIEEVNCLSLQEINDVPS